MIDLELFKNTMRAIEEGFVEPGDTLTPDVVEFLTSIPKVKAEILFKKTPNLNIPGGYKLVGRCFRCPGEYSFTASKTKILNHLQQIRTGSEYLCRECGQKQTEAEQARRESELQKAEAQKLEFQLLLPERTEKFCDLFLDSESDPFAIGFWTPWKRVNHIQSLSNSCDREAISEYIKSLEYKEFLKTPYWKAIASYLKKRADFKCSLCSSDKNLNVHHKTYRNHGYEIDFLYKDFICLCSDCHSTFHAEGKVV